MTILNGPCRRTSSRSGTWTCSHISELIHGNSSKNWRRSRPRQKASVRDPSACIRFCSPLQFHNPSRKSSNHSSMMVWCSRTRLARRTVCAYTHLRLLVAQCQTYTSLLEFPFSAWRCGTPILSAPQWLLTFCRYKPACRLRKPNVRKRLSS